MSNGRYQGREEEARSEAASKLTTSPLVLAAVLGVLVGLAAREGTTEAEGVAWAPLALPADRPLTAAEGALGLVAPRARGTISVMWVSGPKTCGG